MSLISWNESLITGIVIIDKQHMVLVEKINELYDDLEKEKIDENIESLLLSLVAYTEYHFETEEGYFKKFSYVQSEQHLIEHEKFRKDLANFMNTNERPKEIGEKVLNFLNFWLVHHILHVDMEYVDFLKDKINKNTGNLF